MNYCQLPSLVAERLFAVWDKNKNSYLDWDEFLNGLLTFYCSCFDDKIKMVFEIYDFDNDNLITQSDIVTIISCMPINVSNNVRSEGKYTMEGGGAQNFQHRVDTLEEMLLVLKHCFGDRTSINLQEFIEITENVSSDMTLSVLSLMRERLPCSENYWRYRRNYDLHVDHMNKKLQQE